MYPPIAQLLRSHYLSPRPGFAGVLLLTCLAAAPADATPLVRYGFDAAGSFHNGPAMTAAHLTASPWSDDDGTLGDYAGVSGRAIAASSWDDGNAFTFALTVAPGYRLALGGFSFDQRASGTGAAAWTLKLGGTTLGTGATSTDFTRRASTLALDGLIGLLQFRLAGSGGDTSAGTWRIDNFALDGTLQPFAQAVPEPPMNLLLGAVFGGWLLVGAARASRRGSVPRLGAG